MKENKKQGFIYHKFLIYFGLFALAVINSIYAALYFSGAMYSWAGKFTVTQIYAIYGKGLKVLDTTYGCLLVAAAVMALIASYRLKKLARDGVYFTFATFLFQGILPLGYSVWGHFILSSTTLFKFKDVLTLVLYVIIASLTLAYYKKRKAERMNPEQALRLLKDKLDHNIITEEEYQAQRAEIISKL